MMIGIATATIATMTVAMMIAVMTTHDRRDRHHRRGRHGDRDGYGYDSHHGGGRSAVNQCVTAVENWASRYSRADVTQIQQH